ncbi:F-box protein FBW2 [Coffea arabica]|uniref:F-box protein FBW2 n=1 Tax=Coffea arabica TaxID=13443 RepID=A0A6P6W2U2_COFAR|nr:F-box protein FBW2-like [Coffea arabica]
MESRVKTKRVCTIEPKNDIVPTRSWDAMIPEILSLIFTKIVPVEEMVRAVSLVCRGWLETVVGPYCWNEIDVEHWCRSHWNSCNAGNRRGGLLIDSVVRKLVRRSKFTAGKFCAYRLGNAGFSYIANCGRCLKVLKIPVSEITDQVVEKHAELLVNLTELDISYCLKLTSKSLEAFGKHCNFLTHLKRNMPPLELGAVAASETDDDEAFAIANTMAGLDHLEFGFARVTDHGLCTILTACKALTYLDIQGCWNVRLEGALEERCKELLVFKTPWTDIESESEGSVENDSRGDDQSSD